MVTSNEGTSGTKEIDTNYPYIEGTTLGTTKLKETNFELKPTKQDNITEDEEVGIYGR